MGVLNFSTDNLITGVNVIDGVLYWTDDRSEPKKIDIAQFREATEDSGVTAIDNRPFDHTDITVIRPHPFREIDVVTTAYVSTDTQPEPPFEEIFPRFSYRWRYTDGQYSPYAPFTEAVFEPQQRTDTTAVETANYTEGYNTTMFNNVSTITLDNISRGTIEVEAVDILYTESISSTIYLLETIEIPPTHRGKEYVLNSSYENGEPTVENYELLPLSYQVSARKIYRALPANQLTRQFDNIPRLAKSQEITANRLIYGNYVHQYDQPENVILDTDFIPAESQPYLNPTQFPDAGFGTPDSGDVADALTASQQDGLHVKGNRTYEVGVAYIDAFGRQGAMIQAGSITNPDGSVTPQTPLVSDFNQNSREKIVATINSRPPDWADAYRYFIKDVSQDFHSLIAYNVYNDGALQENSSPYVWLEFLSTERNKILDESIIVPRRVNGLIESAKNRHLVQDIENEAPNAVRNQIAQGPDVEYISIGVGALGSEDFQYRADAGFGSSDNFLPSTVSQPAGTFIHISEGSVNGLARTSWFGDMNGFLAQNRLETLEEVDGTLVVGNNGEPSTPPSAQSIAIPFDAAQQLYIQFAGQTDYHQVKALTYSATNPNNTTRDVVTIETYDSIGLVASNARFSFHTARITPEAQERLQGRFWVRVARNNLNTTLSRSLFNDDGTINALHQIWCEVESAVDESQLDLFWESSETFCVCTDHGWPNKINWTNCTAEVFEDSGRVHHVYLESQRTFNRFNSVQLTKGVRVNVPTDRFSEERRAYGLIWSGIYNSRTGINRLNEFIQADGIVKELEPNYGSLQKLHTRDTNLIAMCEDKVFSILADKDLLFNADGGGNVAAANAVLGQTTPYVGEYGISKNPESFASYGNHIWFADAKRGVMIQFVPVTSPQTQLFEISSRGFEDFFRDRLFSSDRIIGMYDDYGDKYVVSLQGYDATDVIIDDNSRLPGELAMGTDANVTLGYEARTEGWVSRYSYIPEAGLTLNNKFYTWKNGLLYMHNAPGNRNTFYTDDLVPSEIEIVFNDQPSTVKEFLTLGYEGTPDWEVISINPESDEELTYDPATDNFPFVRKEGKYFKPIMTQENVLGFTDMSLGSVTGMDTMTNEETTLFIQGTRDKSGMKGFYNVVRFRNSSDVAAELFAINTENFISSN